MEVHHHSHTARKKWTHYFWEFLMLFLAVFCGFLAEYQLEHQIEKDRVKEYMKSMISDLSADTLIINNYLAEARETVLIHESFEDDLYSDSVFDNPPALYEQYWSYFRLLTPLLNDQTITQLRNAGNLRLIKNKNITDKLSEYWNGINALKKIAERVEQRYDVSAAMAAGIFNRKFMKIQPGKDTVAFRDSSTKIIILPDAILMTKDKNDLVTFANIVDRIKVSIAGAYSISLRRQHKLAVDLITLIKEKYHVK